MKNLSIRTGLTIWYTVVLSLGLVLFSATVWIALRHFLYADLAANLSNQARGFEEYLHIEDHDNLAKLVDEIDEFSRSLPLDHLLFVTDAYGGELYKSTGRAMPQIAAGLPVVVGFLAAVWLRSRSTERSADVFAWPMAASLLCAPVVYPWYLLWLLPFLRSASTLPIMIWTVSIIPTYVVWHLRTLGRPWLVPGWIMLLEYGPVATAGLIIASRRLTRRADDL